jgi:hypothetical protein
LYAHARILNIQLLIFILLSALCCVFCRLGLGATARPPEPKGKREKPTDKVKRDEWAKKAEEKLKKQQLAETDIVWLRDPQHAGKRAIVMAVRGVPGLDRIR